MKFDLIVGLSESKLVSEIMTEKYDDKVCMIVQLISEKSQFFRDTIMKNCTLID